MFEKYRLDPLLQLFLKKRMAEKEHRFELLNNSRDVMNGLRKKRKEYLGSDLSLTMFVHENGEPLENVVRDLSTHLGKLTDHFLVNDYHRPSMEELCYGFFYFSLQLYAYNKVGCDSFDDLIRLAELFLSEIDVFTIVLETNLSEDIVDEWRKFIAINDYVPFGFPEAVTGAVAVLLGVLKAPNNSVA